MFNHTTLEQDIKRLSEQIAETRRSPEHRALSDKELVRRVIAPTIEESAGATAAASGAAPQRNDDQILPEYLATAPDDMRLRVEKLIDLVFHKGIEAAVAEARKTNDPFIVDALHDALTDTLYTELVARKLL
ncbi:hypothetical protein HY504_02260 [Candidatus Wolfebacteria bacterium]|nr:hypothetical protein [Candidatus Wolfebacteria bacterium]